jgi:hypothetical protein
MNIHSVKELLCLKIRYLQTRAFFSGASCYCDRQVYLLRVDDRHLAVGVAGAGQLSRTRGEHPRQH